MHTKLKVGMHVVTRTALRIYKQLFSIMHTNLKVGMRVNMYNRRRRNRNPVIRDAMRDAPMLTRPFPKRSHGRNRSGREEETIASSFQARAIPWYEYVYRAYSSYLILALVRKYWFNSARI